MNPLVQIGGASETQAPLWSKPVLAGICMESSRHNGAYISMIFGKMSFFFYLVLSEYDKHFHNQPKLG